MEDQGKRLMLAVVIAFAIMMAWSALFPPEKAPDEEANKPTPAQVEAARDQQNANASRDEGATRESAESTGEPREGAAAEGESREGEAAEGETAPALRGDEVVYEFEFEKLRVRFSSYGGSVKSWELLEERLVDRGATPHKPEDLIRVKNENFQFLRVWFHDSTFNIPKGAEWKGEKLSKTELRFTWESKDIRVVKDLRIHPEDYSLEMKVSLELVGAQKAKQALALTMYSQQDTDVESGGMFDRVSREWKAACYMSDEVKAKSSKSLEKSGEKKRTGKISWGGFDHAYFLSAGAITKGSDLDRIDCDAYPLSGVAGGMGLDLVQGSVDLKNGEPGLKSSMIFYMGPKYIENLRAADEVAGVETKFEGAVDLGWLGMISGPLLWLLNFFQSFVVNWGIAIFLLTMVVKGLTLPWTHKSMKSMKAMAKLKPQLEKIKEKFKDDRAKQNVETMNLFKTHKVNPMSGCLPMLLQMPIWFALYRALTVSGELYQAPFITGWIDDLTLPDPYHIMPVLLTGMMFLQTRMTPSTGSGAQQKMLMYGMPIMFGVFSFFFPSGLTLYIFTNTCFTAAHHLYMHKTDPAPIETAKTAATTTNKIIDVEEAADDLAGESEEDETSKQASSNSKSAKPKKSSSGKSKKKSSGKGKGKNKR